MKSFISRPGGVTDEKSKCHKPRFVDFLYPKTPFSSIFVSAWVGVGHPDNIKTGVWVQEIDENGVVGNLRVGGGPLYNLIDYRL